MFRFLSTGTLATLSIISMVLVSVSTSSAQENRIPEVIDAPMGVAAGLTNIDVEFCNSDNSSESEGHFAGDIGQGESYNLCIQLHNQNAVDAELHMGFVDGAYTVDQTQKRSCKGNEFVERFGQYVSGYEPKIIVPARSVIQKEVMVNLPDEYAGSVRGCLVFSLNPDYKKENNGIFDIVVRKAHFIDFFVDGPIESNFSVVEPVGITALDSLTESDKIYAHRLPYGGIEFVAGIDNQGDVDQNLNITLTLKNFIGKTVREYQQDKKLMAHQSENIRFSVADLPWYKGYFFVDLSVENMADGTESSDREIISASIFLFPVWIVVFLIAIFVLFHLFARVGKLNQKPQAKSKAKKKVSKTGKRKKSKPKKTSK